VIAVTGASGHLGQWVVARLTALGHDVVCVSRAPRSHPSIPGVSWSRPVRTVVCDLSEPASVETIRASLAGVEAVVHLAARIPADTAVDAFDDALATLRANVSGTTRLLHGLGDAGRLRTLVFASSFEVYGPPRSIPIREDHPLEPSGYYGASKVAGEKYAALFGAARGVATCLLRMPAVYGPGDTLRRAVGNFVRAAAAGRPLDLQGDGQDRRDLVYVDDAARACVLAIERPVTGACNLGSGRGFSILEIAATVARLEGVTAPVSRHERIKPRLDYVLDAGRARDLLGWEATTPLADGLRAQLEWVRRGG